MHKKSYTEKIDNTVISRYTTLSLDGTCITYVVTVQATMNIVLYTNYRHSVLVVWCGFMWNKIK